jgi:hypothetical protein
MAQWTPIYDLQSILNPRNRWQDEVREDGRIIGGEGWQGKVCNREEWKKLLRTARNCHNLGMNELKHLNEVMTNLFVCKTQLLTIKQIIG